MYDILPEQLNLMSRLTHVMKGPAFPLIELVRSDMMAPCII